MTNALTPLNVALAILLAAAIASRWGPQLRGDWIAVAIVGLLIGGAAGAVVTAAIVLAPPAASKPPKPPPACRCDDPAPAPKAGPSLHGANGDPEAGSRAIAAAVENGLNEIDARLKAGLAAAAPRPADPTPARDPEIAAVKDALASLGADLEAGLQNLADGLKRSPPAPPAPPGPVVLNREPVGADSKEQPAATVRIVQAALERGPSGAPRLWLPLRADRRAAIRTGQVTFCAGLASDADRADGHCAGGAPNPGCKQDFICPGENFVVDESGAMRKFVTVPAGLAEQPLVARLVLTGDAGVVACQLTAEPRPPGHRLALIADSADCAPQKGNAG